MSEQRNILTIGTNLHGKDYVYEVVKVLGQGSFGITYLAKVCLKGALGSLQGTIHVAIKEFYMKEMNSRTGTAVDSGKESRMFHSYREKFRKEALNLSRMNHPGIVKVLEVFDENNTSYIVMEYLTGGTLDATIKEKSKLPETEAMDTVSKIGLALSYMHDQRMLHLDLKPQNVMFDNAKQPVLIDFGLSKHFEESGEPESSTSIGLGTPGYAPIEQVDYTGGAEFQPTLDIYALGATLYKSLTGQTPPTASTVLNRPTLLHDRLSQAGVSEGTRNVVLKAMQPLKNARPQTVKEFLSMMESTQQVKDSKNIEVEDDESTILLTSAQGKKTEKETVSPSVQQRFEKSSVYVMQPSGETEAKPAHKNHQPTEPDIPSVVEEDESTLLQPITNAAPESKKVVPPVSKPIVKENASENVPVTDKKKLGKEVAKTSVAVKPAVQSYNGESKVSPLDRPVDKPVDKKNIQPAVEVKKPKEPALTPIGSGPTVNFSEAIPAYLDENGAVITELSDLTFYEDMAIVVQAGKYGFVNRQSQLVIPCKYEDAWNYKNGYTTVCENGLYGLIDRSGKFIISCKYEDELVCSDGLIALPCVNEWGYVDVNFKNVIPYEYDFAGVFYNGYAPVQKNGCWGYIDKTGKVVIPLEYQDTDWVNDKYGPLFAMNRGHKWGYVNNENKQIIPFIYDNASSFMEGLAKVQQGAKWGLIDEKGKVVVPIDYDDIIGYDYDDMKCWEVIKDKKCGLLDTRGKQLCDCLYDSIGFYADGLVWVLKDNKYGFINPMGKEVIPCEYDYTAKYFVGGKVLVAKNNNYSVINKNGEVVRKLDLKWVTGGHFYKNWLLACNQEKKGVIDFKGDIILPFDYSDIKEIKDKPFYKFLQNNKYGLFDKNLHLVTPPMYTYLEDSFSEGLCAGGRNGTFGFINRKGEDIIPFTYDTLNVSDGEHYQPFKNGIAFIGGKYINRHNQLLEIFQGHRYSKYILDIALLIFFALWCFIAFGCSLNGVNSKREMLFIAVGLAGLVYSVRQLYKDERLIKNRNKYRLVSQVFKNGISNYYNDSAYLVSNGLLAVCRVDNWGFIDKNHNEVIPPRYKWVSLFDEKNECWAIQANGEDLEVIKVNTKGEERKLTYEEKVEWEEHWMF